MAAFKSADGARDYSSAYRIAFDFHKAHSSPMDTLSYWERVTDDIQAVAADHTGDEFLFALLVAVYDELEREANKTKAKPTKE